MRKLILAIDQGTTRTTCLIVCYTAKAMQILGRGVCEVPQHFLGSDGIEHDLEEIWQSVVQAATQALQTAGISATQLHAIGITNQRETVGVWDRQAQPLQRAIVWQDRRTASRCQQLAAAGWGPSIQARCGLRLDAYFSASKIEWMLQHDSSLLARAMAGEVLFGTIDSWLIYRLTGGTAFVTDSTNASRTMLYDIHRGVYDTALCALFGNIPLNALPRVQANVGLFGQTQAHSFVPAGLPICGVAGDQQAALLGQGCVQPGMAKCTYGTGAFVLVNTGTVCRSSQHGLLSTIAYQIGTQVTYGLEGSVFIAGALVQWLRDGLKLIRSSAEVESLALQVPDSGGVVVLPALVGLGAPHWQPHVRGSICGLTRGTQAGHIARAALEGIALQIYDLLAALRTDSGAPIKTLQVDGGAAANNLLLSFQADLLDIPLQRAAILDNTALGAAHLAALGLGLYDETLAFTQEFWQASACFTPNMTHDVRAAHLQRWQQTLNLFTA